MPLKLHEAYTYCQRCGTPLPSPYDPYQAKCSNCGYVKHFNPITAVGVMIYDSQHRVLLIRRNREPGKGLLCLPGGFVDLDETAEHAAAREVYEEIGLQVNELEFVATFPNQYLYQDVVIPILDIFYAAKIDNVGTMKLAVEEVSEVGRYPIDEAAMSQLAFDSNRQALRLLQSKLTNIG